MTETPGRKKKNYWLHYFLPGILLIGLGFISATQPNMYFALFSFLALFTLGVTLIIEGRKLARGKSG